MSLYSFSTKRLSKVLLSSLSLSFLLLTGTAHATTTTEYNPDTSPEALLFAPKKDLPGTVTCFDYYHFGSVQVDVSPTITEDIPAGKPITFKGKIINNNPYPVVDGQVYVKIFKKDTVSNSLLTANGYPIVDFFLVKDSISLAGNKEQDISFDWNVPSGAGGEYQAAFYFTSAHRYNLLGLSFTDDVTGNKANFSVKGTKGALLPVAFDKNTILLNKTAYHPATFLQHFTKDAPVTVYATLKNSENIAKDVEVTWITSKWDGILASHEQKRETIKVTLQPKESKKISYTAPVVTSSVTFLQGEVKDGDAKSILHIRFVRDGYEEVRTNFPGIMKYPLVEGESSTVFSCVHSTNAPIVDNNTLTLTLTDESGEVLHTYTYTGSITGDMMGVKDSFIPKKSLATFSLTAKLEHGGIVVDQVTMKYDCNMIDKSQCPSKEPTPVVPQNNTLPNNTIIYSALISILVLGGVAGGIYIIRRKKTTYNRGAGEVLEKASEGEAGEIKN